MGLFDVFKTKELKNEINDLKAHNKELTKRLADTLAAYPPEFATARQLTEVISERRHEIETLNSNIYELQKQTRQLNSEVTALRQSSFDLSEQLELQSFGIYTPKYKFTTSEVYKLKLENIREKQKNMIKLDTAVTGNKDWTVNGNASQGRKMVKDMQKLLMRAFNGECDELVDNVKYNNYEQSRKRIQASADAISKLGTIMLISINPTYVELKIQELDLAYEYAQKKQAEKEEQKRFREEEREQAKLQKELEEARKKIEKDRSHYQRALSKATEQLNALNISEEDKNAIIEKISEYTAAVEQLENEARQVDYREANQKAGYVYIISNIGAFGENIYKIGMTRRLDPQDRIDELGDASVPFDFDIHAMIFSNDAPALEAALHHEFEDRKLNMINTRREFFNVTLDEIKAVVYKNIDKTVEFVDYPDAEQYRQSVELKKTAGGNTNEK